MPSDDLFQRLHSSQLETKKQAFSELMTLYQEHLYHTIKKFISDDDLISDILQETFFKAWKQLSQLKTNTNIGGWLYRIAINTTIDYLRKQKRLVTPSQLLENLNEPILQTTSDSTRIREALKQAINQLPPQQKRIFIMRLLELKSYHQIVEELQTITLSAAKAHFHFALKKVQNILKDIFATSK